MSLKTDVRLSPGERFARGLKYTAVGPVDVTRGALGAGLHSAQSSAAWIGDRYRRARVARNLAAAQETIAHELAAAQEVVAKLPQALQDARHPKRRRRPLLLAGRRGSGVGRGSGRVLCRSPIGAARAVAATAECRRPAQALISGNLKAPARQSLRSLAEFFVEPRGFEPLTSALQRQRSTN